MASAMFRSFTDAFGKPKKKYSLETFKQLYQTLLRYPVIDDTNQTIIIETLRSIAELLIWGDQNEQRFFDFFFEKNIHTHFIKVLDQKTSSHVMVQLLQTLSILFENIQTDTSIYFLLSNNYVNTIITHKFDFSDEEILAYYVSFLKTLSLKLNRNTIHFFFNEHLNDFPLYTEAIKFFNHSESMIRVAVRTLTLNVFKVPDERMLRFILDRTAVPYFSNLVWFISDQSTSLNEQIVKVRTSGKMGRLPDLVAEHVDNLYYLNDILSLKVFAINEVLTAQVLKKLIIPLYLHSLIPPHNLSILTGSDTHKAEPRILPSVALYLLAQVMLIFTHPPIINVLTEVLMTSNAAAYFELIDEFQNEMSEVRIGKYAEPPPPAAVTKLVPLSERGGFASNQELLRPPAAAAGPAGPVASPDGFRAPPLPQRVPARPAPSSAQGSSTTHSPAATPVQGPHAQMLSHPGTPTSSVSSRSLGPPVDSDGRAGRVSSELFVFVPKSIIPSPRLPASGSTPSELAALRRSVKNVFRQTLFDHLDASTNDLHALPAICLLSLILKNPVVDPAILQDASFFPRRLMKSKAILNALVSNSPQPSEATALLPDGNGAADHLPDLPSLAADRPSEPEQPSPAPSDNEGTARPDMDDATMTAAYKGSSSSSSVSAVSEAPPLPDKDSATEAGKVSPVMRERERPSSLRIEPAETMYNTELVERVLRTLLPSYGSCRSVTISGAISVMLELVYAKAMATCLTPAHLQLFRETEELMKASLVTLLNVFAEQFVEIFEDTCRTQKDADISRLVMDPSVALPPLAFPVAGLELQRRLPSNDAERIRKSIIDFLYLRSCRNKLFNQLEVSIVPLVQPSVPIQPNDLLELSHVNTLRCTVVDKDGFRLPRLLIVDDFRLILAETDINRPGYGVVREVAPLPAVLADVDKRHDACLDVTVSHASTAAGPATAAGRVARPPPVTNWSAKFEFDDPSLCHQAKLFLDTARSSLAAFKIARVREIIVSPMPVAGTSRATAS